MVVFAALCAITFALAQGREPRKGDDHWVATWTTAQQFLAATSFGRPPGPPRSRGNGPEVSNLPATFADQTVRMIVRVSLGGQRVRVELSNMGGAQPLEVGAAHVGLNKG